MAAVMVNQGEGLALEMIVNKTAAENLVLKLFKNDWTPAEGDDETDATEADFTGYSAKTLTGASWTVTPGAPSIATYAQQEFASTANQTAQTIYGWYLIQTTSGKLMWAERFSASGEVSLNGHKIRVTPRITGAGAED